MRYQSIVIASVLSICMLSAPAVFSAEDTKSGNMLSTTNMTGKSLKKIQFQLKAKGYRVGHADGLFGPLTSRAIIKYQRDHKLPQTGFPDETFRKHLFKN